MAILDKHVIIILFLLVFFVLIRFNNVKVNVVLKFLKVIELINLYLKKINTIILWQPI